MRCSYDTLENKEKVRVCLSLFYKTHVHAFIHAAGNVIGGLSAQVSENFKTGKIPLNRKVDRVYVCGRALRFIFIFIFTGGTTSCGICEDGSSATKCMNMAELNSQSLFRVMLAH